MKTLIIHPQDGSTDFLKPIYETIPDKTVIRGESPAKMNIKELNELIKSHDRIMMMGHGCPSGLFSFGLFKNAKGLVINKDTVELLKEKTNNVYIWCNADMFVKHYNLKGFYSGMFISEVGEAWGCNVRNQTHKEVDESNNKFSEILSKYINEDSESIRKKVTEEYGLLGETNLVARYNNERLFCD